MKTVSRTAIAAGAVALVAGATSFSATAAPLGQNLESLKNSTAQNTTEVQWRRGRNVAIGLGALGAGVVIGSAIAANQQHYYGAPYGYYQDPYAGYGPAYGYGPGYGYAQPYQPYSANRSGNQVDSWDNAADYVR